MLRPSPPAGRGWFITIEGPEGAGKTTQATALEAHLRDDGLSVVRTREPGGTPLGERLRKLLLDGDGSPLPIDPLADAFLFNAARHQLVRDVVRPALDAGTTVICTRYADSTLAYQGFGAGVAFADLRRLEAIATGGLRPDLTILLDLAVEIGLGRKAPADRTRFETGFDLDFHRRVRQGFLALAADEPRRFAVVDAALPQAEVRAAVRATLDRLRGPDAPAAERGGEPGSSAQRIHP